MKKNYLLLLLTVIIALQVNAQCGLGRFHDFVFPGSTLTADIPYGSNLKYDGSTQTLLLDIYEPKGDTMSKRPLIIMAHGGAFLGGTKTGTDIVPLCKDFAKLGYVVASIEYRLGMTNFPFMDSAQAAAAVLRGVHDARAAIRFFRKNADKYKIDVNNIFFDGSSAGAFMALHVAYMNEQSEFPDFIDTTKNIGVHGGLEGVSGNPGYPSNVKAIINMCGAIADTSWIKNGDIPVLSFHGTNDNIVPFGTKKMALVIVPLLVVHGSESVTAQANRVGVTNCFNIYYGQGHVPYSTNAALYDTTLNISRNFLEHFVCGIPLNCKYSEVIANIDGLNADEGDVAIYPNPSGGDVTIDLSTIANKSIQIDLFDDIGRNLKTIRSTNENKIVLKRENLAKGIYFLRINNGIRLYAKRIIIE